MPNTRPRWAATRAARNSGRTASSPWRSRGASWSPAGPRLPRRPPRSAAPKQDWRATATTLAGILSVLLVAAGLFYTNQANRKQQQLGLDQQKLALQGQAADRFTAAIDQLGQEGNDKLSIRLGGVYSLQRLMRDSPTDEPAVIQVLCAFIRTHAPFPEKWPSTVPSSAADVRAALTVLAQRPNPTQPENANLDLSNTLLGLDRTDLRNAHLNGANLGLAGLGDADLGGADLGGAFLVRAWLNGANMSGANMSGANLSNANVGADLRGANLSSANLRNADLGAADLTGADLTGANLVGADLNGAHLNGANVNGADLSYANLRFTDLGDVNGLTEKQLATVTINEDTVLPSGLAGPKPSPIR